MRMMYNGLDVAQATKEYVEKRLERIKRVTKDLSMIEVEIDSDKKGGFRVEIMARTPYALYRSEETSESIEGSADMASDQLYRQIMDDKDRLQDLRERGQRSIKKKLVIDEDARFRK